MGDQCSVVLRGVRFNGEDGWRCELNDDGHDWHERHAPPVKARWRQLPSGGNHITSMRLGNPA